MELSSPVTKLKGVGDELAKKLAILGIQTVGELIENYPRRYEDYSHVTGTNELRPGRVTIKANISHATGRYVRRGLHITEAIATDGAGSLRLVWFNQPYRAGSIKADQPYYVGGEYGLRRGRFSILNPSVELVSDFPVNTARIIPIYKETAGLRSASIRKLIREALQQTDGLAEYLPDWLVAQQKIIAYPLAVKQMHFPSSSKGLSSPSTD